jgi:hypothetical protein
MRIKEKAGTAQGRLPVGISDFGEVSAVLLLQAHVYAFA